MLTCLPTGYGTKVTESGSNVKDALTTKLSNELGFEVGAIQVEFPRGEPTFPGQAFREGR